MIGHFYQQKINKNYLLVPMVEYPKRKNTRFKNNSKCRIFFHFIHAPCALVCSIIYEYESNWSPVKVFVRLKTIPPPKGTIFLIQ